MTDNEKLKFVEIDNKQIIRTNIIANITDKFVQEGEKRFASIKDIISPPIKKTATVSIAEGNLIPLWVKLSKRTETAIFKNPHKTFKIADESFPNGVICLLPIIPVIKWGSELKANIPAKKYITKSVFIFSPPLLTCSNYLFKYYDFSSSSTAALAHSTS